MKKKSDIAALGFLRESLSVSGIDVQRAMHTFGEIRVCGECFSTAMDGYSLGLSPEEFSWGWVLVPGEVGGCLVNNGHLWFGRAQQIARTEAEEAALQDSAESSTE